MRKTLEGFIETFIFTGRWLLAPLYLGLIVTVMVLLVAFSQKLYELAFKLHDLNYIQVIVKVLNLVDIVLVANLVMMVVFSGYQSFVSKLDMIEGNRNIERPDWTAKISYSGIKVYIIGSVVAISAIELLKVFIDIESFSKETVILRISIHLTLTISGVLFAVMEKLMHSGEH